MKLIWMLIRRFALRRGPITYLMLGKKLQIA